jgi:hypothetical protein
MPTNLGQSSKIGKWKIIDGMWVCGVDFKQILQGRKENNQSRRQNPANFLYNFFEVCSQRSMLNTTVIYDFFLGISHSY